MKEIRPEGETLETDENGLLIKKASIDNIREKWKEAVDKLIETCIVHLGKDKIHSIWIRGSVAKGTAKENPTKEDSSDLDSIILTNSETKEIEKEDLGQISKEVREKFPFLEKVELPIKNYEKVLKKDRYKHWRFMLKINSVCVYGEDFSDKFEDFKPNEELAKTMSMDIEKKIEKAKEKIENYPEKTKKWCKWAMNKIVRQGFILVMDKEKTFTRDLYPCYKLFSKHYPEKESEMKEALELAIYPTDEKERIYRIFDDLGNWLIEEPKKQGLT